MTRSRKQAEVHSVSSVRDGLSADVRQRQRRYVISMAIRTLCFLAAIVTPAPWRWILLGAAVLLPHFAVVAANAGREPTRDAMSGVPPVVLPSRTQLTQGPPGR